MLLAFRLVAEGSAALLPADCTTVVVELELLNAPAAASAPVVVALARTAVAAMSATSRRPAGWRRGGRRSSWSVGGVRPGPEGLPPSAAVSGGGAIVVDTVTFLSSRGRQRMQGTLVRSIL